MNQTFFEKYAVTLDESDAIGVIHDQVHKVKKSYKEDKESKKYCHELAKLRMMIEDFFEAKSLRISDY